MTTPVYVLDESNNNYGITDYGRVRAAGYRGVILKVSEGLNFVDSTFVGRAQAAHAAGLDVGGYHFGHADEDGVAQAQLFNSAISRAGVPVPVRTLDAELARGNPEAMARAFVPAAQANLLYSGLYFALTYLRVPIAGVQWWIAAYGQTKPAAPWGQEAGWQFTSSGNVPGVPGQVDVSMFEEANWLQLTGQSQEATVSLQYPPFGIPLDGPIAANLKHPDGGEAILTTVGSIYAFDCPPNGDVHDKPYFVGRTAAQLKLRDGAAGTMQDPWYQIIDTAGEKYPSGPGTGGF